MKRPEYDAAVNVVGTVNVLQARAGRAGDLRVVGRRRLRRVPRAGDRGRAVPAALAVRDREEVRRGVPRRAGTASTARSHVALRFANVYGPRQDAGLEGGVVAIFLERMARGEETMIFGDGTQSRDFVYVGDVVAALLAAVGQQRRPVQRRHRRRRRRSRELHARLRRRRRASTAEPRHRGGAARRRPPLGARRRR